MTERSIQRIFDVVIAGIGLILLFPVGLLIALSLKLSDFGPVFYRQARVGQFGRPFHIWKFRSMVVDADKLGVLLTQAEDPRITRIGRLLRTTKLDQLPQLWNVLIGDMSFVGPRPERPEFVPWLSENIPYFDLRHMIRPGLTGWAQVRYGYGSTLEEAREKLEYDLYYIKNESLYLDLLILLRTVAVVLKLAGT